MNHDQRVSALDVLVGINDLHRHGPRDLPAEKSNPAAFYVDANGDGRSSANDPLVVINALHRGIGETYVLREGAQAATETSVTIGLGQPAGSRTYRFEVDAAFDPTDTNSISEDTLAVYLKDPEDASSTLVDRGTPGSFLFTLSGGDKGDGGIFRSTPILSTPQGSQSVAAMRFFRSRANSGFVGKFRSASQAAIRSCRLAPTDQGTSSLCKADGWVRIGSVYATGG